MMNFAFAFLLVEGLGGDRFGGVYTMVSSLESCMLGSAGSLVGMAGTGLYGLMITYCRLILAFLAVINFCALIPAVEGLL